jgi:HK97 family phage major capsid protein
MNEDMTVLNQINDAIAELAKLFEEYKATNDARIDELEKGADAGEATEKLDNLEKRMSELETKKAELEKKIYRPNTAATVDVDSEKKDFRVWLKSGKIETKSVNTGTDSAGGFTVPSLLAKQIYDIIQERSVMRNLANVITVDSPDYAQVVNLKGVGVDIVTETATRNATNTSTFAQVKPSWNELSALSPITLQALEDSAFDLESLVIRDAAEAIALKEDELFFSGDNNSASSGEMKGLLAYSTATTADKTRAYGTLQHVITGGAGAYASTAPADVFFDLIAKFRTDYLPNAKWVMNRATLAATRKIKNSDGDYLFVPSMVAGVPGTLLGYPVVTAEDMPDISSGSFSVAFGDWKRGCTVADRVGIQMLRNPYMAAGWVYIYTRLRTGFMVVDSNAIKFLKFSAS